MLHSSFPIPALLLGLCPQHLKLWLWEIWAASVMKASPGHAIYGKGTWTQMLPSRTRGSACSGKANPAPKHFIATWQPAELGEGLPQSQLEGEVSCFEPLLAPSTCWVRPHLWAVSWSWVFIAGALVRFCYGNLPGSKLTTPDDIWGKRADCHFCKRKFD